MAVAGEVEASSDLERWSAAARVGYRAYAHHLALPVKTLLANTAATFTASLLAFAFAAAASFSFAITSFSIAAFPLSTLRTAIGTAAIGVGLWAHDALPRGVHQLIMLNG